MISTDRLTFTPGSEVRQRIIDYGCLFTELHVVVFSNKKLGYHHEQLADNVFIHPTKAYFRLGYIWQAIKIGSRLLGREGDWVITSQDPFETGLVAWYLRRGKGIRWQAQIHTDFLSPFFAQESWLNWLRVRLAGFLLPRADKIRVVSLRIKKSLAGWNLKTEPVVLPIFVSPEMDKVCDPTLDLRAKYPQFSFIILMASRLTMEKNFDLALRAFSRASISRDYTGLVIVGQGPEKVHLQALARTLKLEDRVIFEDWQSNLSCYYQTADLFMLTSNYEGYGRTLIEAGLSGCPVLTTEIGLVGEIIHNQNALICQVGGENCLSKKLIWARDNKSSLKSLGLKFQEEVSSKVQSGEVYLENFRRLLVND